MKSFVRKVIFLGLVIVSITMVTSCKQEMETAVEEIQLTEQEAQIIEQYSEIGKGHNEKLSESLAYLREHSHDSLSKDEAVILTNEFFGFPAETEYKSFNVNLMSREAEDFSIVQNMFMEGKITEDEKYFMYEIESALKQYNGSYDDIQRRITLIQKQAMKVLDEDSLAVVMGYSETAKSSIQYWATEEKESLSEMRKATGWELAGLVALADAAGAAEGILLAIVLGHPEVQEIAGVLCGAASSGMTLNNGEFTLIIPIEKLIALIKG